MYMTDSLCFLTIVCLYGVVYIIDFLLKIYFYEKYNAYLKRFGIRFQVFTFSCFTTVFNRWVSKLGMWMPRYQKMWYTLGMWISLMCIPVAEYLLLQSIYALSVNILWKETKSEATSPFLEPAIPGINIPLSEIGYYVTSLLLCTLFHELGHALAAVKEGLHIVGFGFTVLFIVPAAFVQIDGLQNLSAIKQLRVYCAGVWHNFIFAVGAALTLFILPWICYPFFDYGQGVQVMSIHKNSPLLNEGGLIIKDVIISTNKCPVTTEESWIQCLKWLMNKPIPGYCLTSDFIHRNDETNRVEEQRNVVNCCKNDSVSGICFEYLEDMNSPVELPQYSCLRARSVLQHSENECYSPNDCYNRHCFRPSLANPLKLLEIERRNSNAVLFIGYPLEVLRSVHVSEFVEAGFITASIPLTIYKFCNFIIMFSGALAALNLVPCFHFDGQYITHILINICFGKSKKESNRSFRLAVALSITIFGTVVLFIYTILIFISVSVN